MSVPRLILFDDDTARGWYPFTLTRPAGELLFGALTMRERAELVTGLPCAGHLAAEHLSTFAEPGAAPVLSADSLPAGDLLFLSARSVPDWPPAPIGAAIRDAAGGRPLVLMLDEEPCGWYSPAGTQRPGPEFLREPAAQARADTAVLGVGGRWLRRVWEPMSRNAGQLVLDLAVLADADAGAKLPAGAHRLGGAPLTVRAGAEIEPGTVLDLSDGPILIDEGARIRAFTRLAGPAYIGRGSTVLGGSLSCVTIGPHCKVHGEIEASVVLGYANKAHDGFLGHAYVGRWVNLGALTTNSDLKNNYGTIRLELPDGTVDTGEIKVGCLLGDHVKTAIGTMLTTGAVVGPGANLFGGPVGRHVPPFTWGTGPDAGEYELDRFLETAALVMSRRDVQLGAGQRELLRRAWARGRRGSE